MTVPLRNTQYVEAVEINVGVPAAVRYAALRVDSTESSRNLDASDDLPGYAGGKSPNARQGEVSFNMPARASTARIRTDCVNISSQ